MDISVGIVSLYKRVARFHFEQNTKEGEAYKKLY